MMIWPQTERDNGDDKNNDLLAGFGLLCQIYDVPFDSSVNSGIQVGF